MAPIAFLVSQYPAINHAVILHEIHEMRAYLDLRTASIRAPDRNPGQMTDEEREEASRTYFVKPQGFRGALSAAISTFFSRPAAFTRGLLYALKLGDLQPRRSVQNVGYFLEALIVGQWMRREGMQDLHTHYSSTVGLLVKKTFSINLSISFHGPDEFSNPRGFHLTEKIEASSFVRAISHYATSQLMTFCAGEQWEKIEIAYMGVDPAVFSCRPFRRAPSPFEVICVGRLAPVKAQRMLISAIAILAREGRKVRLNVVGGGPDRASLEQYAESLGIRESVVFHGFTPQDRLDEIYRHSDVFALASFAEGLPGVLMEAMAMEIPCVSTWITGVPELIRDGVDGLLVPPADPGAVAGAIARLMDDPTLRQEIGRAGRRRILETFHLQKNAAYLAGIFQRRAQGTAPTSALS